MISGCGEQLMINLAPNVFIVTYLEDRQMKNMNGSQKNSTLMYEPTVTGDDNVHEGHHHLGRRRNIMPLPPVDHLAPIPEAEISIIEKAKKYINIGHRRELEYRHKYEHAFSILI